MRDELHKTLRVLSAIPVVGSIPAVIKEAGEASGYFDKSAVDKLTNKELFHDMLHDGIVVDPEIASSPNLSCTCTKGKNNEDICWKKGIIGVLSQQQVEEYCPVDKRAYENTDIKSRLYEFSEASRQCEIGNYFNDKVITTIEDRLKCMHTKLSSYDITGLY